MARRPYRVEVNYPNRGRAQYFLVRDVKVGQKRRKVKIYLGVEPPTADDVEKFRRELAGEIELKAAILRAELTSARLQARYLDPARAKELEEVRSFYRSVQQLLSKADIAAYEHSFELAYVSGTTKIEGNTLSKAEAIDLLEHGIVPKSKQLREINEVQNFKKVISFRNKYEGKVSLDFIRRLHALVMDNIDVESAGVFRRVDDIGIAGCDLRVAPSIWIEEELKEIISEYYKNIEKHMNPFEAAVIFHYKFEIIHPFTDGNGRVGREILNFLLAKTEYPRMLFLGEEREAYIDALRMGNKENFAGLVDAFAIIVIRQRRLLKDRLQELASVSRPRGQLRLLDFD